MAPPPSPLELLDGGGLSSPLTPPPESSFRELDDAFLQNQTRIWLGEVLNMRFDKDMNISDLLADGQILFKVYKVFRKMLLSGEDHSSRQKFLERESVSSSEIAEIFPYAKVECFLEVCQILGLSDIDLFTTSDVVDKRNTRKVCMCLRFLSKKARSRNLHVPDFDSVTHRRKSPVAMPTDMVGNRRRNLERSSSSPVSDGNGVKKGSRRKSPQGEFAGFPAESNAYKFDVSDDGGDDDDGESNSLAGESLGTFTDSSANGTSPRTPDPLMVRDFSFTQCKSEQLSIEGSGRDENAETECVAESVSITPPSQGLGSCVGDNFQQIDDRLNRDCGNNLPVHSPVHLDWQDGSLALEEDSGGNNVEKANVIAGPSSDSLIEASSAHNAYHETESNMEESCGRIKLAGVVNADLPDSSSVGNKEISPSNTVEPDNTRHHLRSDLEVVSTNDVEATGESERCQHSCGASEDQGAVEKDSSGQNDPLPVAIGSAETMEQGGDLIRVDCRDIPCTEDMKEMNHLPNLQYGKGQGVSNGSSENCDEANSQLHADTNDLSHLENGAKHEREDLKDELKKVAQQSKPPRKMLKIVAGGTGTVAVAGLLLFWLQLRKKATQNAAAGIHPQPNPTRRATMEMRSSHERQEKGGTATNKVYPANKLNFGA